jgi:hypothetical protein
MNINRGLIRPNRVFSVQFGVDPRTFLRSIRSLPRYVFDFMGFRYGYSGDVNSYSALHPKIYRFK